MPNPQEKLERFAEWSEDTALGYVERLMNAWIANGLPAGVLNRAMIGSGLAAIQAMEGHEAASEVIEAVSLSLAENAPQPIVRN